MQDKSGANQKDDVNHPFDDDDILDLADDLLGDSDDDLFTLSDKAPVEDNSDDDILDLTDVVSEPESNDEEIMDLTEIAADDSASDDDILELEDIVDDSADDLMDTVETGELEEKASDPVEIELTFDDDILDGSDDAGAVSADHQPASSQLDSPASVEEKTDDFKIPEIELSLDADDDAADDFAMPGLTPPADDSSSLTDTMDLADVPPETIEEEFKLDSGETNLSLSEEETVEDRLDIELDGTSTEGDFTVGSEQAEATAGDNEIVLDETLDLSDLEREINDQGFELEFETDEKPSAEPAVSQETEIEIDEDELQFTMGDASGSDTVEQPASEASDEDRLSHLGTAPSQPEQESFDLSAFDEAEEVSSPEVAADEPLDLFPDISELDGPMSASADASGPDSALPETDTVDEAPVQEDELTFDDFDRQIPEEESTLDTGSDRPDEMPGAADGDVDFAEAPTPPSASAMKSEEDFIESLGMTIDSEIDSMSQTGAADQLQPSEPEHDDMAQDAPMPDIDTGIPEAVAAHVAAEAPSGSPAQSVSDEQLEAAIENVVHRMFSDKIESILNRVIEQTVTREIERLKRLLLEDSAEEQ